MIKPGPNYKMPKSFKRALATIIDPHERGKQKRLMIQADLVGSIRVKEKKNRNEPDLNTVTE